MTRRSIAAVMQLKFTKTRDNADAQRTSDVAHLANELQTSTRCTRTEALRIAERLVPHRTHV